MTAGPGYHQVTPERCEQTGLYKTQRTQASGVISYPEGVLGWGGREGVPGNCARGSFKTQFLC